MLNTLFVKFNDTRNDEFQIKTILYEEDGIKYAKKEAMSEKSKEHIVNLYNNTVLFSSMCSIFKIPQAKLKDSEIIFSYVEGITYDEKFSEFLFSHKVEEAIQKIIEFKTLVYKSYTKKMMFVESSEFKNIFGDTKSYLVNMVAVNYLNIDLIFENIIIHNNDMYVLDCEWMFDFLVPIEFLIYRVCTHLWQKYNLYLNDYDEKSFYNKFDLTEKTIDIFKEMDFNFLKFVYGAQKNGCYELIKPSTHINLDKVNNDLFLDSKHIQTSLYIDNCDGYIPTKVISSSYEYVNQTTNLSLEFLLENNYNFVKELRWDPIEGKFCAIKISQISYMKTDKSITVVDPSLITSNGKFELDGFIYFYTLDPSVYIRLAENEIHKVIISGEIFLLSEIDIENKLKELYSQKNYFSTIYFDTGNGFNQENELVCSYDFLEDIHLNFSVHNIEEQGIKEVRWDPIEGYFCEVVVKNIVYEKQNGEKVIIDLNEISHNGKELESSTYIFLTIDPSFYLPLVEESYINVSIQCSVRLLNNNEIYENFADEINNITTNKNLRIIKLEEKKSVTIQQIADLEEEKKTIIKQIEELEKHKLITLQSIAELEEKSSKYMEKNKKLSKKIEQQELAYKELEKYLYASLEHIQKLEDQVRYNEMRYQNATIKGRIKSIFKKMGLGSTSLPVMLYRNPKYIIKGFHELRTKGIKGLKYKMNLIKGTQESYDTFQNMGQDSELQIEQEIHDFSYKPLISILMPVYNVDAKWLDLAIHSIESQSYGHWELCIADDGSSNIETLQYLREIKNSKIKVTFLEQNGGISVASNACAALASGEYFALMDNDDELRENALYYMVKSINSGHFDLLYSDEDKIDEAGNRSLPFFKPDWSPDLLNTQMYICHLFLFKKELFVEVGGFRSECDGSQDYDLALRMTELTKRICHIPRILYSWRQLPTSTAGNPDSKPYAHTAGLKAVDEHLKRMYGESAHADETKLLFVYDPRFYIDREKIKVSIIIPTKDHVDLLHQCLESIVHKSTYQNYEVIILNNNSIEEETLQWFSETKLKYENVKIVDALYDFNWSKLNNQGIQEASGDVFIFLNNDTMVITEDWIERLAENALREDIGTVGALLLYEDNTVQHAGVVVGMGGFAEHVYKGMEQIHFGSPYVSLVVSRNVMATTGACLAISRRTIDKIGNFNEDFIICGSDVEISIRAYKHFGLYNLYNSFVKLYHLESKSRTSFIPEIDHQLSLEYYSPYREQGDPFYNFNLDYYSNIPQIKKNR